MIEILPTAADVIAVRTSGKLGRGDIEALIALMEASLAKHDKTHVYAEVDGFAGMELDGMTSHLARAGGMLTRLSRFGRIAVVSDEDWVRLAARIESAVLPMISYKTFKIAEKDAALSWVKGG